MARSEFWKRLAMSRAVFGALAEVDVRGREVEMAEKLLYGTLQTLYDLREIKEAREGKMGVNLILSGGHDAFWRKEFTAYPPDPDIRIRFAASCVAAEVAEEGRASRERAVTEVVKLLRRADESVVEEAITRFQRRVDDV